MRLPAARTRRAGLVASATLALVGGFFVLPSAQAEPKVTPKQVEAAFDKVEAMNEQVNQLTVDAETTQDEIDDLNEDIARDLKAYRRQRSALGDAIAQQQMDAPLGHSANLLSSDDPDEFLAGLGAVQALNSTRSDALAQFGEKSKELRNRRAQLKDRKAELDAAKKKASAKRKAIRDTYDAAKAELDRLTKAQQATFNKSNTKVDFDVDAKGRAKKAIAFAMAQMGEPYVYGGTGPDSWDCSGLMMKAWAAAGVSIPRVVGPQMSASTKVPMDQLQPGDLVAYGNMQHIGMYLGNGRVIHAPRPGKSVEITGLDGYSVGGRVG